MQEPRDVLEPQDELSALRAALERSEHAMALLRQHDAHAQELDA